MSPVLDAPDLTVVDATPTLLSGSQQWLSCYVGDQLVAWVHRRKATGAAAGAEPWRVRLADDAHPTAAFYPKAHAEAIGLNARLGTCQVYAGGKAEALAFVRAAVQQAA